MARSYQIRKDEVEKKLTTYFQQQSTENSLITLSISKIAQFIEEKRDRVFRGIKSLHKKGLLEIISTNSKVKSYKWLGDKEVPTSFISKKESILLEEIQNLFNLYREKITSLEKENDLLRKQVEENDYEVISTQKLPGGIVVIYRKENRNSFKYSIDKNGNVIETEEDTDKNQLEEA